MEIDGGEEVYESIFISKQCGNHSFRSQMAHSGQLENSTAG